MGNLGNLIIVIVLKLKSHKRPIQYVSHKRGLSVIYNVIFIAKFVIFFHDSINERYNAYPYCQKQEHRVGKLDVSLMMEKISMDHHPPQNYFAEK